jgi:type II secretory pathway pseudopilin PulG
MKKITGFTLIELVMIIVVIAVIAISVMPRTVVQSSVRLEAACQKIASDLRYVQEMSMAEQVRFGISFDPATESYFAYRVDIGAKAKDPQTRGDLDISLSNMSEFKGIEIASTNFNNIVEFDSIGAPYDADNNILTGQGTITVQTIDAAYSRTVRIEPKTGKVSIQ